MRIIEKLMAIVAILAGFAACKKNQVAVQSISLDKNEMELAVGDNAVLTATVLPGDAEDKTVVWSSADPEIATVADGVVKAVKVGETKITAQAAGFSAECAVSVFYDAPAVDLGLSVKWASYNVGALNVEGRGSYFAWGETRKKENYGWTEEGDYLWGIYNSTASPLYGMTKYTADAKGGDGLKTLLPEDDPATVNWGTKWRTPTSDEIKELTNKSNCEWTWDEARKGYVVKSHETGNSIFLPAAGYRVGDELKEADKLCSYWTSSVYESSLFYARVVDARPDFHGGDGIQKRCHGLSVRAVAKD